MTTPGDSPGRSTRREALHRLALFAASTTLPWGCAVVTGVDGVQPLQWLDLPPLDAPRYGTDPDLIHPAVPWQSTFTTEQRRLVTRLADILIPAEGTSPAASAVGVVDVLDEWISAPYSVQAEDRRLILSGLRWIDSESARRHAKPFVALDATSQLGIIDLIAFPDRLTAPELTGAASFFDRLRYLVTGMFYSSPEGILELGYVGNVPIAGEWPGPTTEAMQHLQQQLDRLRLT
jgi:hypothetical protein